jgi:rare lipoprotein A
MNAAKRTLLTVLGLAICGATLAQTPPRAAAAPPTAAPAPAAAATSDRMQGFASVYSDRLDGRKTASGEVFNQQKLTAAHPTLPFGTKVKVTNTNNDMSVEVTINDRGPTRPDRCIDLSSAAAAKIDLARDSIAPVKLEIVAQVPSKK